MITFDKTFVTGFSLDYLLVSWTILPTTEDLTNYTFSIYRSNSPEGKFVEVVNGLSDIFGYKDTSVTLKSQWRKYWYKVRATDTRDQSFSETDVFHTGRKPDMIASEIVRRNEILLGDDFIGRPAWVAIKRTFGQRCVECWDFTTQRKSKDNCKVCWNTGFVGGYFVPIKIQVNIDPESEAVRIAQFKMEDHQTGGWMSNYPLMSPGDILIEDDNKRWYVVQVRKTEQRRAVIKQVLQLKAMNKTDIEYQFPIPGTEDL